MGKKIGFVGLGTMGLSMAVNLKKAGFEVIGYDAFKGSYDKASAAGITMVESIKEVAEQADEAIISMVRDYAQNMEVIFGEGGIVSAQAQDKTIIVMSTLDPDLMNGLCKKVEEESNFKLIDAAVSGGPMGAKAGTLSIMTSGPEDLVKSFRPYFDAMGANIFYFGPEVGNSQTVKLINNSLLGIHMVALAEGFKLGKQYNLPEDEVLNLLKVSTGDSWVARNWKDISEWTADTALSVLLKDLKATYHQGLKYNVALPFNGLASIDLFNAMGKEKPVE